MEKLQKLTIAIILGIVALGFQSCGDDEKDEPESPLLLSQATLIMKKGETKSVEVGGGTGDYRISIHDDFYIHANAIGTELSVTGRHVGTTVVDIHSGSSIKSLTVNVETEYPEVNIPLLNWGSSLGNIADNVNVSEQGEHHLGYKYIEVTGKSPIWSDETYYFKDDKLVAVRSYVRKRYSNAETPILIMGERFQPTNKTYQGYYIYNWFEKPNNTRVRLCTSRYFNGYSMEVWYSTSDRIIEQLSEAY